MKKKLIIGSVLSMLLLSGCSVNKIMPLIIKEETSQTTVSTLSVTKEEYVNQMETYHQEMKVVFEGLSKTSNDLEATNYLELNKNQVEEINKVITKYKQISPPSEFTEIHQEYMIAMEHFEKGINQWYEGLTNADEKLMSQGMEDLTKGQDYWNYAFSLLSINNEFSIGDGTITTQDLKDLDKLDGIDRDSVLLNLSKDGKELIGKWGKEIDGVFHTMVIFYEDGSYEKYKAYPDKSSMIKGKWKYNYIKQTLTIFNEEAYENGVSIIDKINPEVTWNIQAFHFNKMKMLEEITLTVITYTKEESNTTTVTQEPNTTITKEVDTFPEKVNSDSTEATSILSKDLIGLWSGINDELSLSLNLYEDGTFLRGELFSEKTWIYGTWTYDEVSNSIRFINNKAEIGKTGEKIDYPAETIYKILELKDKELHVLYEGNNEISLRTN